jgi:hypothetical protein
MHRHLKTQNIFLGRGTAVGLFRALYGVQSGSHYHYNTCNIVQHCLPTVRIAQHAIRDLLTFFVSNPRRSGETGRFWYFPGVGTNRRLRHHRGGDAVLPEPGSVPEHAVHPEIGRVEFRVCDFRGACVSQIRRRTVHSPTLTSTAVIKRRYHTQHKRAVLPLTRL